MLFRSSLFFGTDAILSVKTCLIKQDLIVGPDFAGENGLLCRTLPLTEHCLANFGDNHVLSIVMRVLSSPEEGSWCFFGSKLCCCEQMQFAALF